ncbi:hypothetical protein [Streptomyces sp. NPDC058678]|uniref:hypothetical protein n=1 Tax=Streptomyces sp. NPDC058678 TaxID=3346595 RepID=UPI00365AE463
MIRHAFGQFQYPTAPLGSYASGFPDDLAFEDWLARLDTLADAHERLREGEQVSGPAAETYRHRVEAATRFAGRVLRTKRHANAMLTNPDLQIFPGKGMTCVLAVLITSVVNADRA